MRVLDGLVDSGLAGTAGVIGAGRRGLVVSSRDWRPPTDFNALVFAAVVKVIDLGLMDYGECLTLQRRLRDERQRGEGEDVMLIVEHPPVATLGRRGTPEQVFDPTLPVYTIERGGEATYHAPGQLVLYPIVHLGEGNRDVRAWVRRLERFLIDLLARFDIAAESRPETPGVWTVGSGKKIASIGIAIQQWVSFHGLALNVDMDLHGFERINPCGLGAAVMTTMARETGDADLIAVRKAAIDLAAKFSPETKVVQHENENS